MNQLVEKFCNLSLGQSWCEDVESFISNVSSKYEANAMKAISYVILGCFSLLIFVVLRRTRSKPKPKPKPKTFEATRSFIVRELHSGNPAMYRLMTEQYQHPSPVDSADALIWELKKELPDLLILQQKVRELEMWEEEDRAEKILRRALKEAIQNQKPHEAYEFEMLIVEVLIYKGGTSDLDSALKCECLKDTSLKDARRPLFQAIIHELKGNMEKVKEYWDEFIVVRDPAFGNQIEIEFDKFQEHVVRLQKATEKVKQKRSSISTFSI